MNTWAASLLLVAAAGVVAAAGHVQARADASVVAAETSRNWLNYRHVADEAIFRQAWLSHGTPESAVFAVVADEAAADLSSNPFPGQVLYDGRRSADALGRQDGTVPALAGADVSSASLLALLAGRPAGPSRRRRAFAASSGAWAPPLTVAAARLVASGTAEAAAVSSLLLAPARRTVATYLNGHGGDGFLKVHDIEAVAAADLAWAEAEFRARAALDDPAVEGDGSGCSDSGGIPGSGSSLTVLDTCQAGSLWQPLPPALGAAWASSGLGRNSYASPSDGVLGVSPSDGMMAAARPVAVRSAKRAVMAAAAAALRHKGGVGAEQVPPARAAADAAVTTDRLRAALSPTAMLSQLLTRPVGSSADPASGAPLGEQPGGTAAQIGSWANDAVHAARSGQPARQRTLWAQVAELFSSASTTHAACPRGSIAELAGAVSRPVLGATLPGEGWVRAAAKAADEGPSVSASSDRSSCGEEAPCEPGSGRASEGDAAVATAETVAPVAAKEASPLVRMLLWDAIIFGGLALLVM